MEKRKKFVVVLIQEAIHIMRLDMVISRLSHTRFLEGTLDIHNEVRIGYENDPWFQGEQHTAIYTLKDGLWWTKEGQLIVPNNKGLRRSIISEMHDTPLYGHNDIAKTKKHVQKLFWWPTMLLDIIQYVKCCPLCQVNKSSTQKPGGTL
eukprot:1147847-Pelagomonas_calceolata.AAC.3